VSNAEEALVGALLLEPANIAQAAAELEPAHFGERRLREMYEAMVRLAREGKKVDAVTLRYEGHDPGDVILHADGSTDIDDYINIIQEQSFRRVVATSLEGVEQLLRKRADRASILGALADLQHNVASDATVDGTYDQERAVDTYKRILHERKTRGVGLPYGIPHLDRFLQPAHGGDMVVVAARPSVGKTVVAEHVADAWSFESDLPVLFISVEMSLGQLMDRAVSRWGGIPNSKIVRGTIDQNDEERIKATLEARQAVNLWYVDNPYSKTDTIRAAAAEVAMQAGGIRGIVVDYLQLLKDGGDNDNQRISRISRSLKALAREYDCPMLVLSQLNRQSEYRDDPHPRLSDIRDSGAVEQDADVVLGLYRDKDDPVRTQELDISILKNRQGPLARVTVPFDGDHVRLATDG
jgi:replicative DNA helicase